MCAILDVNVRHEVLNPEKLTPAGKVFDEWINEGENRLVIGGKITDELVGNSKEVLNFLKELLKNKKAKSFSAEDIETRAKKLKKQKQCQSNDLHIIALAQISGARLLYSEDQKLQEDFKNKNLLDQPRGKIYPNDNNEKKSQRVAT